MITIMVEFSCNGPFHFYPPPRPPPLFVFIIHSLRKVNFWPPKKRRSQKRLLKTPPLPLRTPILQKKKKMGGGGNWVKKWNDPIMTILLGKEIQGKSSRVALCFYFLLFKYLISCNLSCLLVWDKKGRNNSNNDLQMIRLHGPSKLRCRLIVWIMIYRSWLMTSSMQAVKMKVI